MSRLDSAIRRLEAQRAGLDWACAAAGPGAVLELGLGNGRTYDHLRACLGSARAIHAFDFALAAHPDCVPPADLLHLGDMRETLPRFAAAHGRCAALVHADTGSGAHAPTAAFAAFLGPVVAGLMLPGGLVLSDQALQGDGLAAVAPPAGIAAGRYFFYRAAA